MVGNSARSPARCSGRCRAPGDGPRALVLAAAAPMRYASGVRADDIVLLGVSLLAVALGVLVALLTLRALRQLWCELGPPAAPPGRGTGRRGGGATLARWWAH